MNAPQKLPTSILDSTEPESAIELPNLGWKSYSRMLRLLKGRRSPKLIYLDGDLTLLSPISFEHEFSSRRLTLFVVEIALGLGIPFVSSGQTTFRRRSKRAGVEGDDTFYFGENEALVRGKKRLNPRIDPAPDLAIEIVVSHPADKAVNAWKRLGVREIWVLKKTKTRIISRTDDGKYAEMEVSRMLPTVSALDIHEWATRSAASSVNVWLLDLRSWVRDVLIPRLQQGT
jgi:Uma2 family endonuclease